jgi:hypothetical protein
VTREWPRSAHKGRARLDPAIEKIGALENFLPQLLRARSQDNQSGHESYFQKRNRGRLSDPVTEVAVLGGRMRLARHLVLVYLSTPFVVCPVVALYLTVIQERFAVLSLETWCREYCT